ncbi:GNAT family N-acetyltransferase [Stigmatella aurantiaca]|uniref:acetyltransferase, GNAT family n=1 Tax=Stigmatella aurantiaca (strain DW4/3-1) TaxID=378806 RepID=Q093D0_STIAD|nr:GNAT family N-acetyltransferase [Stigmatella aurantiaca]ADO76131.1 Acetyltransferase, GNAT family [Stigmatella aurantiaca DW4/3-1]EAU66846.1 acetyltransferase, gnat family [Stigmatella aurantiaca DW4/3-1]
MPSLRPVHPTDDAFLFKLYASTRQDLAHLGLAEPQKELLLRMQWKAQWQSYSSRYPGSAPQLVLVNGQPVGRLWVARVPGELRVMDISLLPEHRGAGLGTGLLRALQQEATAAGTPVRLSVAHDNPARRLYERLGFTRREGGTALAEPFLLLEWTPPAAPTAASSPAPRPPSE